MTAENRPVEGDDHKPVTVTALSRMFLPWVAAIAMLTVVAGGTVSGIAGYRGAQSGTDIEVVIERLDAAQRAAEVQAEQWRLQFSALQARSAQLEQKVNDVNETLLLRTADRYTKDDAARDKAELQRQIDQLQLRLQQITERR